MVLVEDTLVPSWRGHPRSMQPEREHVAERLKLEKAAVGESCSVHIWGL